MLLLGRLGQLNIRYRGRLSLLVVFSDTRPLAPLALLIPSHSINLTGLFPIQKSNINTQMICNFFSLKKQTHLQAYSAKCPFRKYFNLRLKKKRNKIPESSLKFILCLIYKYSGTFKDIS